MVYGTNSIYVPNSIDWPVFVKKPRFFILTNFFITNKKTRFVCCEKPNLCILYDLRILYAPAAGFKRPKDQIWNKIITHELNAFYLNNKIINDINIFMW